MNHRFVRSWPLVLFVFVFFAAPAGMLLQMVSGLGDNADWSNASSKRITRMEFTNNAGFFRAAAL